MPKIAVTASLAKVQWMTISEMAELWAPQLKLPATTIERELRFALYKILKSREQEAGSFEAMMVPLDKLPPEEELPRSDELVSKEFIEKFCRKQTWLLPKFWTATLPKRKRGRPDLMQPVMEEMQRRALSELLRPTLAAECRELHQWAKENLPREQVPAAKSIQNKANSAYRALSTEINSPKH